MTLIIRRTVAAAFGGSLVALLSSPVALGQTPAYSLRNTLYSTTKADGPQGARAGYDSQDNAAGTTQQGAADAFKALPLSQAVAQKWDFLGPTTGSVVGLATFTGRPTVVSGRITGLAISPSCNADSCPLFVAAAGGGVWRTKDGLSRTPQWTSVSQGIPTNSSGSIIFDPTDSSHRTLYFGSGEVNGSEDSEAGRGLFKSALEEPLAGASRPPAHRRSGSTSRSTVARPSPWLFPSPAMSLIRIRRTGATFSAAALQRSRRIGVERSRCRVRPGSTSR